MKRGEKKRGWTPEEDRELREIAAQNLNGRIMRGNSRLHQFALKHGRTLASVKMRAKRIKARSYLIDSTQDGKALYTEPDWSLSA